MRVAADVEGSILVANRSHDKAVALAATLGGRAVQFSECWAEFAGIDIVISSTAAPHYLLETFAVSYAPSASALVFIKQHKSAAAAGGLLAFGDPVFLLRRKLSRRHTRRFSQ